MSRVAWKRLQIGRDMLLIITSNSHKLFIGVKIDDLEWFWTFKIKVLVFWGDLWLRRRFQEWIASKWIEIDQDNLQTGTAKAISRFMSFAQITSFVIFSYEPVPYRKTDGQTDGRTARPVMRPVRTAGNGAINWRRISQCMLTPICAGSFWRVCHDGLIKANLTDVWSQLVRLQHETGCRKEVHFILPNSPKVAF